MSVLERYKQRSMYKKSEDVSLSSPGENVSQSFPLEQLSPLDGSAQTGGAVTQLSFTNDPITPISDKGLPISEVPEVSSALIPLLDTDGALPVPTGTKTLRKPTRIRGTGKKSSGTLLAPKVSGKRTLTHAMMVILTFLVVFGVLAAVVPLTPEGNAQGRDSLFGSIMKWVQGKGDNTAQIASQLATATAVMQDGYDHGGNSSYPGLPGAPSGSANLNRFYYPQCTYYANMEYGQLTGHYVPWLGNADAWASQARAYGWNVSSTPKVPSIVAFDPYTDGSGGYGHVGVVTSINGNNFTYGSWNVYGYPPATTVYQTDPWPAAGVWFLSYPGA